MAEKKKPIAKGITPKGVAVFPYLNKPDTKFKAEGEYRVKLRLGGAEAEELKAKIDAAHKEAFDLIVSEEKAPAKKKLIKPADKPYQAELDKETGEETGFTLFTFKQKARIENKTTKEVFEKKIDLFDAAKKKLDPKVLVYGGSTMKVAYEAWPFFTQKVGAGVTLRLCAVQVIELVSAGARNAEQYGFGDEGEGIEEQSDGEGSSEQGSGGESTEF